VNKEMNRLLGAVAGGAAVKALDTYAYGKMDGSFKDYLPMLTGLGLGILGAYGTASLPYSYEPIVSGMGYGALGVTGSELLDLVTKQGRFTDTASGGYRVGSYGFSYPTVSSGYQGYAPVSAAKTSVPLEI